MSDNATQSSRPLVNLKGLHERVLLDAALMRFNAQLRDFTPLRDRLVAHGEDANAAYRQIESQRDQVIAELKKLAPRPDLPVPGQESFHPTPPGGVLSAPLAPALFLPASKGVLFGYSGSVQIGAANEGKDEVPIVNPEAEAVKGDITTMNLDEPGRIYFNAHCEAYDFKGGGTGIRYLSWLHSWTYLIPFPASGTGRAGSSLASSLFTYSFPVVINAIADVYPGPGGGGFFQCFVAVGETPDFVGQEVIVNYVGSPFPIPFARAELSSLPWMGDNPPPTNHILISGETNVQRSFVVQGGHIPAVAVAVGVVVALEAELFGSALDFETSTISTGNPVGIVDFRYEPPAIETT